MKGMEAAIRSALERAGIPGAQARERIYDSARGALKRSLERQGIEHPERAAEHRQRLEALIAEIESEWTPPAAQAPNVFAHPAHTHPADGAQPAAPTVSDAPVRGSVNAPPVAPPSVAPPSDQPRMTAPDDTGNLLDIAPGARSPVGAPAPSADAEIRAPRREAIRAAPAQGGKPAKPAKVARPRKEKKRRRPIFASIFSAAVLLSFLGIGVWWVIESGALKSAAERDTGVPNPPPSLSRDDYAGGPRPLNPGTGFSGEWASVFTPGRDGTPTTRGNAQVEVIEEEGGNVLRIVSGSGDESGEVLIPLGAEVMQALAGRQSMLALTVRSASSETTQIYVRCEFSVLGDCGRRRFDVSYETTDLLFSLDYDRALAPNEAGNLVINSDISGAGHGIDLLAVRIRPAN
ncbi:hypothetical protein ACK6D9_06140 [Hoeflea sp. Naph1]|uniref:hypothetical protein n=1 Tax=Hoeflea sp. Naph1 TaxID=3388653 RepID=UPI00399022F3